MFGIDDVILATLLSTAVNAYSSSQNTEAAKEAQNKSIEAQRKQKMADMAWPTGGTGPSSLSYLNPQPTKENTGIEWIQPGIDILKMILQGGQRYKAPNPLNIGMSVFPPQNAYGLGNMKLNSPLGGGYGRL